MIGHSCCEQDLRFAAAGFAQGTLTVSAILMGGSGGEVRLDNNNDADKVEYFPQ